MSYILDALRRAESERGRGAVPGLHTQAPATGGAAAAGRPGPVNLWAGVALSVLAVAALAAGGTWWFLQRQVPAGERMVVAAPVPAAVAPAPAPAVAPMAPAAPAPIPAPRPVDKRPAPPPRERPAAPVAAPPAPRASAAAEPPGQSTAQEPAVVFAQGDLPDAVRAQLPALKVTGATHSNNPAYRMAIVNGQVLHEGEQAAPGLLLERIEPGRTVWSFRGYRYAVASQ